MLIEYSNEFLNPFNGANPQIGSFYKESVREELKNGM